MKTDEYYKFTKGFFEAFKWEVIALKNQTHTELLRYQFDDIDTETLVKNLTDHVVKMGEYRSILHEILRFARIEPSECDEYKDALEVWNEVDRLLIKVHSDFKNDLDIKDLLRNVSQSCE